MECKFVYIILQVNKVHINEINHKNRTLLTKGFSSNGTVYFGKVALWRFINKHEIIIK